MFLLKANEAILVGYSVVLQSKFIVNISFCLISAKVLHKVKIIDFFPFFVVASNNIMLNFPLL